jgi:hypothetical protein
MSTTWITIVKVAGPCCTDLADRVNQWYEAVRQGAEALENAPTLHSPMMDATEIEIRRLLTLLETHATLPPVVFFDSHLDARTMGHEFFLNSESPIGHLARTVTCNDVSLWFLSLELEIEVRQGLWKVLTEKSASAPFEETRRLFTILGLCLESWHALLQPHGIPSAMLLFFDRVGASWIDREVVAGCSTLPEWLPQLPWSSDPTR